MNLVVFKFVQLGDNVVFVPVIEHIRRLFPDWKITLLTTPREVALYSPWISDVVAVPQLRFNSSWKRPGEFLAWFWEVRRRRPDACLVSMDQGNVAHTIARWSGAPIRVGARLPHVRIGGSITHDVPLPADGMMATWHWEMARALIRAVGADESWWPKSPPPPNLWHLLDETADDRGPARGAAVADRGPASPRPAISAGGTRRGRRVSRSSTRPHIVIHPGSNQVITRWPLERYVELAGRLACDCHVTWIDRPETLPAQFPPDFTAGSPSSAEPMEGRPLPGGIAQHPSIQRVSPADLHDFASVLAAADLFVGNNSGPMHFANALGCRGVVIAGPSARGWDPYWHRERWRVLRHPTLPCAPCEWATKFNHECALLEDRLACLNYWTVDAVEAHCREMLTTAKSAGRG